MPTKDIRGPERIRTLSFSSKSIIDSAATAADGSSEAEGAAESIEAGTGTEGSNQLSPRIARSQVSSSGEIGKKSGEALSPDLPSSFVRRGTRRRAV